jgi:hypothetical protein
MRIGSEAPKRRTHSSIRHESQGTYRDSATSNRHRRSVTSVRTRPKLSGFFQRPPFIGPDAKRRRPAQRPAARAATGRSEACAPRPRSWACEYRERSRCGLETTASRRCPSGAKGTATPIESYLAELDCKYAPNIDPTSSSAHPVDIVRIFRMAEDPAPALVATPHKAQKTILDQTLRSKRQGLILRAILQPGK